MKIIIISIFVLTNSLLAHSTSFESQSFEDIDLERITNPPLEVADSLIFVHAKRCKTISLKKGVKIKVLTTSKQKISGEFSSVSKDSIVLRQTEGLRLIAVADIKKVILFNEISNDPITGTLRFIIGTTSITSLGLGGIAIIGGVAALKSSILLSTGLFVVSVPLIYYGLKLHFLLKNADRKIVRLNKGWVVSRSESKL